MKRLIGSLVIGMLAGNAAGASPLDVQALLKSCPAGDEFCPGSQKKFVDEYASAWKRRYTSQRNVAYMLEDRDSHPEHGVVRNWVSACAWRAVILNSRSKEVDDSDRSNLEFTCKRLNPAGRVAAMLQAEQLMAGIYKRPLAIGFALPQ